MARQDQREMYEVGAFQDPAEEFDKGLIIGQACMELGRDALRRLKLLELGNLLCEYAQQTVLDFQPFSHAGWVRRESLQARLSVGADGARLGGKAC